MKDPYETLGVERSATDKQIKDAFKKLARKFHPDLHPGDKAAEEKFKAISSANDFLKDNRSGSIAILPTGLVSLPTRRRMALPAMRTSKNFSRVLLEAEPNGHRVHSGRVDKM